MLIQERDYTRHPGTKREHLKKCVGVRTETINGDRQPKFSEKNKFNKKKSKKRERRQEPISKESGRPKKIGTI